MTLTRLGMFAATGPMMEIRKGTIKRLTMLLQQIGGIRREWNVRLLIGYLRCVTAQLGFLIICAQPKITPNATLTSQVLLFTRAARINTKILISMFTQFKDSTLVNFMTLARSIHSSIISNVWPSTTGGMSKIPATRRA